MFFASIAWAFARPPARAGHELLWLCALLTLAIPVAGAIGSGEHMFAAFANGHWHRFGVDASALVFALAFRAMARATLRRGFNGDPKSVWALPARTRDVLQESWPGAVLPGAARIDRVLDGRRRRRRARTRGSRPR